MNSGMKHRVCVAYGQFGYGGSEAQAAWALEALKGKYALELATIGDVDLSEINRVYQTSLDGSEYSLRQVPMPRWVRRSRRLGELRRALFQRYVSRLAANCDVVISASNAINVGTPAIQYVSDFYWDRGVCRQYSFPDSYIEARGLRRLYHQLVHLAVTRPSNEIRAEDTILANSMWTARVLKERYGVSSAVLYPPVVECPVLVPFEKREDGFVCLGRIVREKGVDVIIDILSEVRKRGHRVHLHVLGQFDESEYCCRLKKRCGELDWVCLEGLMVGEKKWQLLSSHRYGLHACKGEAFGIAVAEMMMAGCVPFVPSEGGTAEVACEPQLIYHGLTDAVDKIDALLRHQDEAARLSKIAVTRAKRFSTSRFKEELNVIVESFLSRKYLSNAR